VSGGDERQPALDGLRGLAIFAVLLYHGPLAWRRYDHLGFAGVDLFFVLSGFLITGLLWDARGGSRYFSSFYARRTLRIFPLYYVLLAIYFHYAVRWWSWAGPVQPKLPYLTYTSNFHVASLGHWTTNLALDPTWSLAIEEQFYLVWPLVVRVLGRRALMIFCGVLIVGAFAARLAWALAGRSPIAIYCLPYLRVDSLATGAFVALAARGPRGLAPLVRPARWVAAILTGALATGWAYDVWSNRQYLAFDYHPLSTTALTPIALAAGACLTLIVAGDGWFGQSRLWRSSPLRSLGRYSYAIYLVHLPLVRWLGKIYFNEIPYGQKRNVMLFTSWVALAWAGAFVSWHLFEKQILRLKALFPYGRVTARAKAGTASADRL
jgi:peptidoglycan/LPS O-acetylase OafA/YrhL